MYTLLYFTFFLNQIFILEKCQIYRRVAKSVESFQKPLIQYSLKLKSYITIVHLSKPETNIGALLLTKFQTLSEFYQLFTNVLFLFLNPMNDLILHLAIMSAYSSLVCDSFLVFLFFVTLALSRYIGQIFCQMSIKLGLSNFFFFMIRLRLWGCGKNTAR